MIVSCVKNATATATQDCDTSAVVNVIRTGSRGKLRTAIEEIRRVYRAEFERTGDSKLAKIAIAAAKKKLPGVLWSGRFHSRERPVEEKLLAYTGRLCGDLDNLGERLPKVRAKLEASPHLFALFLSPTGEGLKAVFRVTADPAKHHASFLAVRAHVLELTGERIDESCKDVTRLCFLSFDPDAYHNPDAVELPPLPELPKRQESSVVAERCSSTTTPDVELRRRVAVEVLGETQWKSGTRGFCICPGRHLHTNEDKPTDCEVLLDNAPTVHCFHNSCRGLVEGANHTLRSRIGKLETLNGNHTATPHAGASANGPQPPAEIAELVGKARAAFTSSAGNSATSTNSTGAFEQPAIYPKDSILADWMDFARAQEESADAFLMGSALPLAAALLARRVWFQWGARRKFPNVFTMLAGKPGDRKSSIIGLAEILARRTLPDNAFLPASFSPESLFDEYAEEVGGLPDKLWIVDDANGTLTDWQKAVNGERVASRFLELYDCKGISESFRRNKKETASGTAKRFVSETSTNLLFGATFNIACFQNQAVRAGMARRFLYYVAERHGRMIARPEAGDVAGLNMLAGDFAKLRTLEGPIDFTAEAAALWEDYQRDNRAESDSVNPLREAALSRLSSAPMQVLSIAMIFEAARWARDGWPWTAEIQADTLLCAIEHVAACLRAADFLETISHRASIAAEAEILIEHIRRDLLPAHNGFLFATRSQLTKRYCPNSSRAGAWKPDDLYLRFLPHLERQGEARRIRERGGEQSELFAFRAAGW